MNLIEFANKLYNAGFDSRQAGDIVIWMAEPFSYDRIEGLVVLEDVYRERLPEESIQELTPAQYRSQVVHQQQIIAELWDRVDSLMQFPSAPRAKLPKKREPKKVGVDID